MEIIAPAVCRQPGLNENGSSFVCSLKDNLALCHEGKLRWLDRIFE